MSAPTLSAALNLSPLLDLLRTLLVQYGEVTLRHVPAGHEHGSTGYVAPHERVVGVPTGLDDRDLLAGLVRALYGLAVGDLDPRLGESACWFAADAAARTLAAMGVAR